MNKLTLLTLFFAILFTSQNTQASPVFSANGFKCGKKGITVTCKGSWPDGTGSVMGTGQNLVYLTMNAQFEGKPFRCTYFSDTGCLSCEVFDKAGKAFAAVANHRSGAKKQFQLSDGNYEKVLGFCSLESIKAKAVAGK